MKKWKAVVLLSLTGLLTFGTPAVTNADWTTTDAGKMYTTTEAPGYLTGMKKIGSKYYYFDSKGIMQTGFQTINGKVRYFSTTSGARISGWKTIGKNGPTYYFRQKNGSMVIGFKTLKKKLYYFNDQGILQKGWLRTGDKTYFADENGVIAQGKWVDNYYFLDDGTMAVNQWINGKWVGADGKYTGVKNNVGWVTDNGKTYYYDSTSTKVKGFLNLGGKTYYLHSGTGELMKGWIQVSGKMYYASSKNGVIQKSKWIQSRYLSSTGVMATGLVSIDSQVYLLDSNGYKLTGWQTYNNTHYYFSQKGVLQKNIWVDDCYVTENGTRASGFLQVGSKTYYFDPATGAKQKGWLTIDGKTYRLHPKSGSLQMKKWLLSKSYYASGDGSILKGLNAISNELYYFDDTNGLKLTHKTKTIGNDKYYFKKNGKAARNMWVKLNNNYYYFQNDGKMARSTWVGKYYVGPDGARTGQEKVTGWSTVNGNKFYFDDNAEMVTGFMTLNGSTYYFNPSNGAMVTGLQTIGTNKYYFYSDGKMAVSISIIVGTKSYTLNSSGVVISESDITISGNTVGTQIVNYALKYVGNPYVYGGVSLTNGADCSGFVMTVFSKFNIKTLRVANDQMYGPTKSQIKNYGYTAATVVDISSIQPGDLLFYGSIDSSTGVAYASHVAIYMGNGQIVHASNSQPYPAGGIKISNYDYRTPLKAIRYWS